MSTFVMIPGAGGAAWYWHRVVPLLQGEGHEALAVDLPGDDDLAGLPEYTRQVVNAIGDRGDVVIVAQSLGGFTAPLVASQVPVDALVFVNAMIPSPGETPGGWWDNTGWLQAFEAAARQGSYGTQFDPLVHFLHDVPPQVAAEGEPHQRPEADTAFRSPAALRPGRPSRFVSWPVQTTGSSLSSFSGPWPGIGSASRRTCYPAAT
jgi:hypothetical protein